MNSLKLGSVQPKMNYIENNTFFQFALKLDLCLTFKFIFVLTSLLFS